MLSSDSAADQAEGLSQLNLYLVIIGDYMTLDALLFRIIEGGGRPGSNYTTEGYLTHIVDICPTQFPPRQETDNKKNSRGLFTTRRLNFYINNTGAKSIKPPAPTARYILLEALFRPCSLFLVPSEQMDFLKISMNRFFFHLCFLDNTFKQGMVSQTTGLKVLQIS